MRAISAVSLLIAASLAVPARAADTLPGTYALPNGQPKVSAVLSVSPDSGLRRTLDFSMTPIGGTKPVVHYETELSKQLHAIAVSDDLRDFVHEHGDRPGPDGHFHLPMTFPHAGRWYIFADAVPEGLGHQVMRFDLALGHQPPGTRPAQLQPSGTRSSDGRYAVQFDAFDLKAGRESHLTLHLLRDDRPAPDVTPFLGVAAHAVFIDSANLTYVHVHAAPAKSLAAGGKGAPIAHDVDAMQSEMGGMEGMGPPLPSGSTVPPDLTMHVLAPKAGTYVLWLQFDGGGRIRTVRFVVPVH